MNRKLSLLLCVCACFLGMNAALWSQNATATRGVLGYLDPHTGAFRVLPHPNAEAEPPATTTVTGKLVFNFTITVDATIASTAKIACSASAITEDNLSSGNPSIFEEEASALATRTGSTATCTVNIPYSWKLATSSTDSIVLEYTIDAPVEATSTTVFPTRLSSATVATIKVPASGTTTTETITATF